MKKLITTLQNIWKIKDLRERILFTLFILAVYRFGCFVVLPGVDAAKLKAAAAAGGGGGLLDLINAFSGGAFLGAAVFALGIMPYITASIIIQLLGFAVPYFQRLQQREGEAGRKKLTQITRWLTVAICMVQGSGYLSYLDTSGAIAAGMMNSKTLFYFSNLIILTTGTVFAMWLGEKITDKGIGNGISLLITIGIIATLPGALAFEITSQFENNRIVLLILEFAALFAVVVATVLIVQGVRRIPIQFAKRMVGRSSNAMPATGNRDYIPLKVNAAGVMPIIFAQALMFLPAAIGGYVSQEGGNSTLNALSDFTSLPYNIIYFILVVVFTYVYTALLVNPTQYAEYLKRQNAFIPGIKPGKNTADFIDSVTSRITLPGSIFLGLISVLPAIAVKLLGINIGFAMFFGGTSLLILVAVVLDTLQQIDSHLLMRKYDGLVKSGRAQGRSRVQGIGASM
ncbi:MAG: preprotein translocase subunit SecY [Bacteroidota bacterium]